MADKRAQREWLVLPETTKTTQIVPASDHTYDLMNLILNDALVYGERKFGINLVWGDPAPGSNVRFARASGASSAIQYGESIAINVRNGGWLVYRSRDVGVNLGWSASPVFEWRFDGESQGDISLPAPVAIHNSVEDDWLIYGERDWGINLRWSADRDDLGGHDIPDVVDAAKDAWDTVSGWF